MAKDPPRQQTPSGRKTLTCKVRRYSLVSSRIDRSPRGQPVMKDNYTLRRAVRQGTLRPTIKRNAVSPEEDRVAFGLGGTSPGVPDRKVISDQLASPK